MRIFNLTEHKQIAQGRKPMDLAEARRHGVTMTDARLREIADKALRLEFVGGLDGLDAALANARKNGFDQIEMLAVDASTASVYAVNTEGYAYARYMALVRS